VLLILLAIAIVVPGDETPPLPVLIGGIISAILLVVGAVGLWMCRRWGALLGVAGIVVNIPSSVPGLFLAPDMVRILIAISFVFCAISLALLARPAARQSYR